MGAPSVIEDRLVFTLGDDSRRFVRVSLDCDDALEGRRRFRRTSDGWTLSVPRPALNRVEYRLVLTLGGGDTTVVCDPHNPERVETAFGERSVAALPPYTPPAWMHAEAPAGDARELVHQDATLGPLPFQLWSPSGLAADEDAPLLVVHDGPEYARLSALTRYAAAMVGSDEVPPFRMALMHPVSRDDWYAANRAYVAAELAAVDLVAQTVALARPLVVMGASLGGLAALVVALCAGPRVGGVFAQSGSFFDPALDAQESSYPFFGRVTDAVQSLGTVATPQSLTVGLTCGRMEENWQNNVAMAARLTAAGHRVDLTPLDDLHNHTAWRDGLDPALTQVLQAVWGGPSMVR